MAMINQVKSVLARKARAGVRLVWNVLRRVTPEPAKRVIRKILQWGERRIIAQNQELLRQILREQAGRYRSVIVFPPSLDWNVQLFQRPQQLALALARQGALVFYLQPKPDRKQPPFQEMQERLYLCNVHVESFRVLSSPIIYLLTWNSDYARAFNTPRIIYDFVDDIDVFYGDKKEIVKGHHFLLKNAALVLATARKLVDQARQVRPDVIFSPNGAVYEHFASAARRSFDSAPEDLQPILAHGAPVIGYYGALARWFDYDLLKAVAEMRPDYQFVLIGPDYDGTVKPANIGGFANIHWLGVKPYEVLPHYLQYFDVATIPFIVNEITHAVSPLKLFEYMASETPVVITPMHESMHYPGVLVGEDAGQFAQQIDRALQQMADPACQGVLRETALDNTWERRAEDILLAIEKRFPAG